MRSLDNVQRQELKLEGIQPTVKGMRSVRMGMGAVARQTVKGSYSGHHLASLYCVQVSTYL